MHSTVQIVRDRRLISAGAESNVEESKAPFGYFDEEGKIAIWPDRLEVGNAHLRNSLNGYADELVQSGDVDTYPENKNIQSVLERRKLIRS